MSKRMLIDASHPEETRVVVLDGQKVEEFDFEAATKRPLKGNIYLAKITRVEPSLQAAFVEYGGNRQGFLAFSEIHPDYYQIPVADRQALLAEQEAEARRQAEREDAEADAAAESGLPVKDDVSDDQSPVIEGTDAVSQDEAGPAAETNDEDTAPGNSSSGSEDDDYFPPPDRHAETDENIRARFLDDDDDRGFDTLPPQVDPDAEVLEGIVDEQAAARAQFVTPDTDEPDNESETVHEGLGEDTEGEAVGAVDPAQEIAEGIVDEQAAVNAPMELLQQSAAPLQQSRPSQRWTRRRHYKIQEVIKRRQIILVQVVKEERGNKGAALTTYLSLAGRYCVLMPNTPSGGGISRKITSAADRKRLKSAVQGLELPEGMGLIIRTAGENRTKTEFKRDYEYLLRMWDTIRELTLKSNAPACVYEEGDLIKRAIRDLYNKDVSEIIVEGDEGYRNAKDFMRMLMPSHAKNVKPYKEPVPLFQRHSIEAQLDAMFSPTVHLKSGGYVVINQTEALVAIDVNSGRATREHSIEETAHKTNLEAADEIGRQLRLRDLAGLIVIDFIDMEDHRNDRNVEKRLYNAVKNDRARIQVGKISQFGLLEMSRQRLRAGVIAGSTVPCPHCAGQGIVRSVESTALRVLRGIEDEAQKLKASAVTVKVPTDVAVYTLNQKRRELARIEADYGMTVNFEPNDSVLAGNFEIERTAQRSPDDKPRIAMTTEAYTAPPSSEEDDEDPEIIEEEESEIAELPSAEITGSTPEQPRQEGQTGEVSRRSRRRRGGRNRGRSDEKGEWKPGQPPASGLLQNGHDVAAASAPDDTSSAIVVHGEPHDEVHHGQTQPRGEGEPAAEGGHRRRRRRRGRRGRKEPGSVAPYQGEVAIAATSPSEETAGQVSESEGSIVAPNSSSTPLWSLTHETVANEPVKVRAEAGPSPHPATDASMPLKERVGPEDARMESASPRRGWWQRTFKRPD